MQGFIGPKPDRQHMQALARCKLPENENLLALFRAKLEETKAALLETEEPARIYRLQGRAKVLAEFLEAVERAPEVLDRLTK